MHILKIATLCSGIGAPEKALRQLGIDFNVEYFSEVDKYAIQSYCAIHSEKATKNLGDLTKVDIEKLPEDLDLIVGGTPCQDFSVAGKRAGGEINGGTRSSLMWNFVEIVRETTPKVVLWENVPGCLTAGPMKRNYSKFVSTLSGLGYKIYANILNAKKFGIPQNRDRVFVIAIRKELDIKFAMPVGYDCGIRLKDILESEVEEKYYLSEQSIKGLFVHKERHDGKCTGFAWKPTDRESHAACLRANSALAPTGNKLIEHTQGQSQGRRVYDTAGVSVTLASQMGGLGAKTGLYTVRENTSKGYATAKEGDCVNIAFPTSKTRRGRVSDNNTGVCTVQYSRIRRLTPRECFRLMCFTDADFDACKRAGLSDSQLYEQAGNSIVEGMY